MSDLNKSSLRVEVPDAGEEPAVAQRTGSAGTPSTTRSMLTPLTLPLSAVSRLVPGTKKSVWQVPHRLRSSVDPRARAASQAIYQSQVAQSDPSMHGAPSPGPRSKGKSKTSQLRSIRFAPRDPPALPSEFPSNRVDTAKYNVLTFLPIFLFEMFSRVAYIYFLLQAGLSWWSVVSPFGGVGATAALVFVLLVAAVKAVWEDTKRHQEDRRMNRSITHRLQPDGSIADIQWTEVRVGDAIVVRDDELFPADLLCLHSALPDRVCFMRTTNLDGETNLKIRRPIDYKGLEPETERDLCTAELVLAAEAPNRNLHRFKGQVRIVSDRYAALPLSPGSSAMVWTPPAKRKQPGQSAGGFETSEGGAEGGADARAKVTTVPGQPLEVDGRLAQDAAADGTPVAPDGLEDGPSVVVPVTMNEMLLRGCMLKNSNYVVGLVVYTGAETRIQMNAARTPNKVGSFDRFLNLQIGLIIAMQLSLVIFCATANLIWQRSMGLDRPHLALDSPTQGIYANGFVQWIINLFTFWILLSYLVPISLFVTLEIVKFWQGFVYINLDPALQDPATKEAGRCRNSGLNEDLGRVEYVFSDKTGTLTSNEMQLRAVAIKGVTFGNPQVRLETERDLQGMAALRRFDPDLADAASALGEAASDLPGLVTSGGSGVRLLSHPSSNLRGTDKSKVIGYGDAPGAAQRAGALKPARSAHEADPGAEASPRGGSGPGPAAPAAPPRRGPRHVRGGSADTSQLALGAHLVDFWTNVCICQSLIIEAPSRQGGLPVYQGPSPDEVALVEAARQMGFVFRARAQSSVTLELLGQTVVYEVLNVMEYSSERGCMSIVARSPDGSVRLYCKGADAKVLPRLRADTDADLVRRTQDNLHAFAQQGLRTLLLGTRIIDEREYQGWDARYQEAASSFQDRDARMDALGAELERELELVGVTAIEDKLQDGVPAAVSTLLAAGMRVWMITGDKLETALNIAVACRLVADPDAVLSLCIDEGLAPAEAPKRCEALLDAALAQCSASYCEAAGLSQLPDAEAIPRDWQAEEMVVDGPTLAHVLGDARLSRKLALLASHCRGVVIARSSPSQKAGVVALMKEYEMDVAAGDSRGLVRWYKRYRRRLAGKMLAIGDGANDVAMLQTADVGVGIMGKEGRQATNNADYAVTQFRFLVQLLLVHGNLSYYRLARLIKYSFYKNITFAFVLFYYQFYNGYSGQALVDSITAAVFNVVFTSLPILLFAVLDRPVRDLKTFLVFPQLYDKRASQSLTTLSFWKTGVLVAIFDGAVCFFVPYFAVATSGDHNITDVYSIGKIAFVALLGTVTLEVALVARYWTVLFAVFVGLSYVLVYPYMLIFPLVELGIAYYDPANVGVAQEVMATGTFWFSIVVCYLVAFSVRFADRTLVWLFRPQDTMLLAEAEDSYRRGGESRNWMLRHVDAAAVKRLVELGVVDQQAALGALSASTPVRASGSVEEGASPVSPWHVAPGVESPVVRGGRGRGQLEMQSLP